MQGVFFRDSTRRFAQPLGIRGHAINLANGNVEVKAVGEPGAIEQLAEWLQQGPPSASVTDVSATDIAVFDAPGFVTG